MIAHIVLEIHWAVDTLQLQWVLNPLVEGCEQDEDYVGRAARLNRRVSQMTDIRRTVDKYLVAAKTVWNHG